MGTITVEASYIFPIVILISVLFINIGLIQYDRSHITILGNLEYENNKSDQFSAGISGEFCQNKLLVHNYSLEVNQEKGGIYQLRVILEAQNRRAFLKVYHYEMKIREIDYCTVRRKLQLLNT